MYIEQLYTGCLSEAAYYIESEGQAAVIDPLRDIDVYTELATSRGASSRYIFETHVHADFVSGHLDLSRKTGAPIVYGPETKAGFDIHLAKDGEEFGLGKVRIRAIHTPGHTLESTCYLLLNEEGKPHALFTGDTLFVGEVGRPDLAQDASHSKEELAGMLYESLEKIKALPDDVLVYPAHGPGSSCGKNIGPSTHSTLGAEKQSNYALQPQERDEFIKAVTDGLAAPPQYFPVNARINKEGYDDLESILARALTKLDPAAFRDLAAREEAQVVDTRNATIFTDGFVPGSISIGLEGRFAEWAGMLLSFSQPILLITDAGKEEETAVRLARVGFSKMHGVLDGGFEAWKEAGLPVDMIINVEPDELAMDLPFDENLVVVDVRKEMEFADGHVRDAVNIPLENLVDPASMSPINDDDNLYLHCAGGYRSVIAASLFKRQGIHNVRNVLGGFSAIKEEEKIPTEKNTSVLN